MKFHLVVALLLVAAGFTVTASNSNAQEVSAAELGKPDTLVVQPTPNPAILGETADYVRPTERQKLRSFEFNAIGPFPIATALAAGGYQQYSSSPPEWGQGAGAFGARVASNFGIQLITETSHYGLAEIVREDVSYYPCGCKGFFPRFGHAIISTVTARRGEDGHTTFSLSGLVSPYVGTMSALAWYPSRFGVKDGFRMGNYNLLGQAAKNVAFEFIYGGPHAMFGRNHVSRFSGEYRTAASNP